ncbi:MAG: phosphatidate cytidylyltransferase [Gammaproteobacteria bacterium]
MLKQRVLTALVLIPLVVWAIFGLPTPILAFLFAVLVLLGGWEWTRLIPVKTLGVRIAYLLFLILALYGAWLVLDQQEVLVAMLLVAAVWWIFALGWVANFRGERGANSTRRLYARAIAGYLTLVPSWTALMGLHVQPGYGAWLLLYVLVLMWVADSGAYFAGRSLGRHKLAPKVSPGKTWEGVAGGLVATAIYASLFGYFFGYQGPVLSLFAAVSVVAVAFSVVGDLFESLLKRQQGVKDSGTLLPGHGGVLDRIDSVTAGAPLFLLGLHVIGWPA